MADERELEQKLIVAEIERSELRRELERLAATLDSLRTRIDSIESTANEAKDLAEDLEEDVDSLENGDTATGSQSNSSAVESDLVLPKLDPPHAYKVITTNDDGTNNVYCLLPKKPDGSYLPAAMGGKHLGSDDGKVAEKNAGPYPFGGSSGSDSEAWARYGWLKVGTLEADKTNDKIVVAKFTVPCDPPKDQRGSGTSAAETKGPQLTDISLMDASDWKSHAELSWKEYDDPDSGEVTREVPIALVANGLVTQLTMTPYIGLGGGEDSWLADSDGGVNFSIDPKSRVPIYETEDKSEEVPQYKTVIGIDGETHTIQVGTKTVTKKVVKTDGSGNAVQKTTKYKDEDGKEHEVPVFSDTDYHQVHNFDTGNDGGEIEGYDENGYAKDLIATRVKKGGGYELMWRKLPKQAIPCPPPEIEVSGTKSVTGEKAIDVSFNIVVTNYAKSGTAGECSGTVTETPVEFSVPLPTDIAYKTECVVTGVEVTTSGITFHRKNVLVVAGAAATSGCKDITIAGAACEET